MFTLRVLLDSFNYSEITRHTIVFSLNKNILPDPTIKTQKSSIPREKLSECEVNMTRDYL